MPKRRKKVIVEAQRKEIKKILKKCFIREGSAFFRKDDGKLFHIINGQCIKHDCNYRDNKTETMKILVPTNCRKSFKTLEDGTCLLPKLKQGKWLFF